MAADRIDPGQTQGASADDALTRFAFHAAIAACVDGADFVQENAPERREIKIQLLARIDAALPADRLVASSTSGFSACADARHDLASCSLGDRAN